MTYKRKKYIVEKKWWYHDHTTTDYVSINGETVSDSVLVDFLNRNQDIAEKLFNKIKRRQQRYKVLERTNEIKYQKERVKREEVKLNELQKKET